MPLPRFQVLAIHLDREQNKKRCINPQTDIVPLVSLLHDQNFSSSCTVHAHLADWVLQMEQKRSKKVTSIEPDAILDFDLCFYDVQPAAMIGLHNEFIAGARLDNLLSCFVGLHALIHAEQSDYPTLLVCSDHEEIGSMTAAGALGAFFNAGVAALDA